jgi:hypothetical protein
LVRELDAGDPSLGRLFQPECFLVGEVHLLILGQQRLDFLRLEDQVRKIQAAHIVVGYHQRDVLQFWQRSGGKDQVEVLIRQPHQPVDEGLKGPRFIQELEVVEHQHEVLGDLIVDLVDQRHQQRLQPVLKAGQAAQH